MREEIPEIMYDRLAALLAVDGRRREELLTSFGLSQDDETTLRGLVEQAVSTSYFDLGIGSMFPSLLSGGMPEVEGFELIRELGRGGMGIVYLARDRELDRYVALKFIRGGLGEDDSKRLLEEARTVAKLDHHGIVQVHQFGRRDDLVFIASGYIEGETLKDRIAREREACEVVGNDDRRLDRGSPATSRTRIDEVLKLIREIAAAMTYAHGRGIVHRDLKPSNILIDEHARPYVADFGIALRENNQQNAADPVGTIGYMSPEQLGAISGPITPASDVFSIGVLLYEFATLRRPFGATTLAEARKEIKQCERLDPRKLCQGLPPEIGQLCRRAMMLDPAERYEDAGALLMDIDQAIAGTLQPPSWSLRHGVHLIRRHRIAAAVLASVGMTVAASGLAWSVIRANAVSTGTVVFDGRVPEVVSVRPFDPETRRLGGARKLRVKQGSLTLPAGRYRITVTDEAGTIEYTRMVIGNADTVIFVGNGSRLLQLEEMVLVPGGEYIVGYDTSPLRAMQSRVVTVDSFLIDRHEVTNEQYRAFVLSTGHRGSPLWGEVYDEALDHLPVVGVSQNDARAYAEWAGKRLPTDHEWEIAAAGFDRRAHPWGAADRELETVQIDAPHFVGGFTEFEDPQYLDLYLGNVLAADSDTPDITPSGIMHLSGNVAEWTDSVMSPYGAPADDLAAIAKGNTFMIPDEQLHTNQEAFFPGASARTLGLGFRCAASIPQEN
jgi:serine/threonine protein kinase/formylglycine-generating enzyme required for sulfatase activity